VLCGFRRLLTCGLGNVGIGVGLLLNCRRGIVLDCVRPLCSVGLGDDRDNARQIHNLMFLCGFGHGSRDNVGQIHGLNARLFGLRRLVRKLGGFQLLLIGLLLLNRQLSFRLHCVHVLGNHRLGDIRDDVGQVHGCNARLFGHHRLLHLYILVLCGFRWLLACGLGNVGFGVGLLLFHRNIGFVLHCVRAV